MKAPRLRGCFLYKNRYRQYAGQPVKTQPPRRAVFPQGGWWSGGGKASGKLRLHGHFGLFFYALGVDVE